MAEPEPSAGDVPRRRYPCAECPFRRDTPPGMFPACRYDALRATAGAPGREAPLGAPMFACHKSAEGGEEACAGWLAVEGYGHLGVRLAVALERLPVSALSPGAGRPELFGSYGEMSAVQGGEGLTTPTQAKDPSNPQQPARTRPRPDLKPTENP